ncbi:MAG TPA: ferredoxin [Kineosporiaceae bacterium]|nr:ferredoxin [Kineosporiaceae bacterium]
MSATRTSSAPPAPSRPVTGPRLQVDWTLCEGRGHCFEMLPELLGEDPWGYPIPRAGNLSRGMAVPPHLLPHARDAVVSCPRLALLLRED